jgi:hypothetical protein
MGYYFCVGHYFLKYGISAAHFAGNCRTVNISSHLIILGFHFTLIIYKYVYLTERHLSEEIVHGIGRVEKWFVNPILQRTRSTDLESVVISVGIQI